MSKSHRLYAAISLLVLAPLTVAAPPPSSIELRPIASVSTGSDGPTGAEIVTYDASTRRAFAINSSDNEIAVIDLSSPAEPVLVGKVSLAAYGVGLNSVATHAGLVAVAVEASPKTDPGAVVFLSAKSLAVLGSVTVGALPDMLVFTDDGTKVLVANEGEPNSYGLPDSINPEGSISIVDLSAGVGAAVVNTAGFSSFNGQKAALLAQGIRIFGPGATVAQDLEPEYITQRGRTAWVTLQEANAIAIVDLPTATVQEIVPLGLKNHAVPGNGLDPSDRDGPDNKAGINIGNWPVFGMYQPDAIASFRVGRDVYLVTANEGDARSQDDFPGYDEEVRVGSSAYPLDPIVFPDASSLKSNAALGRLTVSRASGDVDGDGDYDRIDAFGARSVSIWNATGQLVWDSGDQIESFFANPTNGYASIFNASNNNDTTDDRSDNKGPEPEGIVVGRIGARQYAFVGLERVGGVMAYDITDPAAPSFAAYANTRAPGSSGGDRGPEGLEFVSASDSPNGMPLVLVGNEVSRTVTVLQVNRTK